MNARNEKLMELLRKAHAAGFIYDKELQKIARYEREWTQKKMHEELTNYVTMISARMHGRHKKQLVGTKDVQKLIKGLTSHEASKILNSSYMKVSGNPLVVYARRMTQDLARMTPYQIRKRYHEQ